MKIFQLLALTTIILVASCAQKTEPAATEEPQFATLTKVWETDSVLLTPEAVIYDEFRDVLYVANIAGTPHDTLDYDGFISIVSMDGEVINRDWVSGGISSMKGMGILDSSLFVTDMLEVIEIDIPSGEIINKYAAENAGFLNDITVGPDKTVYISDSRTNSIHQIKDGEISLFHQDSTFQGSNGLLHMGDRLMVAGFGSGNLMALDPATKEYKVVADSILQGDGINAYGDDFIVSCWRGVVFQAKPDGTTKVILDTQEEGKNAADAWYVAETSMLYIPTFFGNTVAAYKVE